MTSRCLRIHSTGFCKDFLSFAFSVFLISHLSQLAAIQGWISRLPAITLDPRPPHSFQRFLISKYFMRERTGNEDSFTFGSRSYKFIAEIFLSSLLRSIFTPSSPPLAA